MAEQENKQLKSPGKKKSTSYSASRANGSAKLTSKDNRILIVGSWQMAVAIVGSWQFLVGSWQ